MFISTWNAVKSVVGVMANVCILLIFKTKNQNYTAMFVLWDNKYFDNVLQG